MRASSAAPFGARDRAGEDRLERPCFGLGERHRAAARAGHEQAPVEAGALQPVVERAEIDRHARPHVRVDHGRRRALVLAVLAGDLVRERDLAFEAELPQRRFGGELVRGIRVRMQERNGHAGDAVLLEDRDRFLDRVLLERRVHAAVGIHPLGHRNAPVARHERRRMLPEQVVRIVAVAAAHLEDVAEALRREQADDGARPRQERVEPDGRAVEEVLGRSDTVLWDCSLDGVEDAVLRGSRRRRLLADADLAGLVVIEDEVGERAADVDADARGHGSDSPVRGCVGRLRE